MAMTLVEGTKYSNDILQVGVIEKLVYQDPILERLQWKDIRGNGLTYDVEATMSSANFYAVNDDWNESTSTVDQHTAVTTILGGDADVDNFLKATRSDLQDLMGEQINKKIKAIKKAYMEMFFYGYKTGGGADSKGFDGLQYLIRSQTSPYINTVNVATVSGTEVALSLTKLEEAVDSVKWGNPDLILMSKQMRRNINKYLRGVGGITYMDAANGRVQELFGVAVAVSDYISNTETCNKDYDDGTYGHDYALGTGLGTTDNATTIFVLQFAPEAVCGIQTDGTIKVVPIGDLEGKDGQRTRIKWYPGLMLQNIVTVAKVGGIKNDTAAA